MKHSKKSLVLCSLLLVIIVLLTKCMNNEGSSDPRGNVYAGSKTCRQCHQAIYDTYLSTTHYLTTRPSAAENIQGSFAAGQNVFSYDSVERVVMEKHSDGLYQVAYKHDRETDAHRFDMTFGVKHAQTYLYWQDKKSFELPVSYYVSIGKWATSPGFPADHAKFNRYIGKDCFECHTSYINGVPEGGSIGADEVFNRPSLIYGIDCERCHGPGLNHANFQTAYPAVKEAKYMVSHTLLSRQQSLDMCAVCHSGNKREKEVTTFAFKLGDTLANYFSPWSPLIKSKDSVFDVHGTQYQLLASSMCFMKSNTLTCTTCHDPHTNASTDLAAYSAKCITCHQNTEHSFVQKGTVAQNEINKNCIDCHMPQQSSQAITFNVSGHTARSSYLLRTHKIAIYRKAKKEMVAFSQ